MITLRDEGASKAEEEMYDGCERLDIDEALKRSGPYGKFQVLVQIFFMYAIFVSTYQSLTNYFGGDNPSWICVNRTATFNGSSRFCSENVGKEIAITNSNFSKRCSLGFNEWSYTKDKDYSYVTEFDLICDKSSLAAIVGGILFIGSALASIVAGTIADIYGRKFVLFIALLVLSTSSTISSFVTQIWQLMLLRALIGAGQAIGFSISYIYLAEFIWTEHRAISCNICNIAFTLSMFFLCLVAYFEQRWRRLQLYLSLPAILAVVVCFFIPKSPRWLLVAGKCTEAEKVMKRILKINGKRCRDIRLKQPEKDENQKKYTYIDLFRTIEASKVMFGQSVVWLSGGLLYFAVTLQSSNLGGSIYSSFAYVTLPDLPCCFLTMFLCDRFGRKKSVLSAYGFVGLATGGIAIVQRNFESNYTLNIILSIIGKIFLNVAYNANYLWTFELLPTIIRTQGFSVCLIMSSIGSAAAPFLSNVLELIHPALPYEVMCVFGIATALIGMILPETKGCPTREFYEDFGKIGEGEVRQNKDEDGCTIENQNIDSYG